MYCPFSSSNIITMFYICACRIRTISRGSYSQFFQLTEVSVWNTVIYHEDAFPAQLLFLSVKYGRFYTSQKLKFHVSVNFQQANVKGSARYFDVKSIDFKKLERCCSVIVNMNWFNVGRVEIQITCSVKRDNQYHC